MFQITKGKQKAAQKVVIYGVEGVGKTTLASQFPNPVFLDIEDSTTNYDVARLPKPSSWQMLIDECIYILENPTLCSTLVVDSVDWAEKLLISQICTQKGWGGLNESGYGIGYSILYDGYGKFLNLLTDIKDKGVNVVLIAHAQVKKFDRPDQESAYDRFTLNLTNKVSDMTKEWADNLLFCNFKSLIYTDEKTKKVKAAGMKRVIYTERTPAFDAKNRFQLPSELPLAYESIAAIIPDLHKNVVTQQPMPKVLQPAQPQVNDIQVSTVEPTPVNQVMDEVVTPNEPTLTNEKLYQEVENKQLKDLLMSNDILPMEFMEWVGNTGYFTRDMPIGKLPADFIAQVIAQFDDVKTKIKALSNF